MGYLGVSRESKKGEAIEHSGEGMAGIGELVSDGAEAEAGRIG